MVLLLHFGRRTAAVLVLAASQLCVAGPASPLTAFPPVVNAFPSPLLNRANAVDWRFAFKLNAKVFPGCTKQAQAVDCPFGGTLQTYEFGRQFVFASGDSPALHKSDGCLRGATDDPLGATFDEIYGSELSFVVWNDQFYGLHFASSSRNKKLNVARRNAQIGES